MSWVKVLHDSKSPTERSVMIKLICIFPIEVTTFSKYIEITSHFTATKITWPSLVVATLFSRKKHRTSFVSFVGGVARPSNQFPIFLSLRAFEALCPPLDWRRRRSVVRRRKEGERGLARHGRESACHLSRSCRKNRKLIWRSRNSSDERY